MKNKFLVLLLINFSFNSLLAQWRKWDLDSVSGRFSLVNDSVIFTRKVTINNLNQSIENYFYSEEYQKKLQSIWTEHLQSLLSNNNIYSLNNDKWNKYVTMGSFIFSKMDSTSGYNISSLIYTETDRKQYLYTIGFTQIFQCKVFFELNVMPLNQNELIFFLKPKSIYFLLPGKGYMKNLDDISKYYNPVTYNFNDFYINYLKEKRLSSDQDICFKAINITQDLMLSIFEKSLIQFIKESEKK